MRELNVNEMKEVTGGIIELPTDEFGEFPGMPTVRNPWDDILLGE